MPGELAINEICLFSDEFHYKTKVYFILLDAVVIFKSIKFDKLRVILKYFYLLSPRRILNTINEKTLTDGRI